MEKLIPSHNVPEVAGDGSAGARLDLMLLRGAGDKLETILRDHGVGAVG